MGKETDSRSSVIDYYNEAQFFYKYFWHGNALGLHYGFWDEMVSDRRQAIIRENELLADLVGIKPGDYVLDAGGGIGGSGLWLARERGANVTELDLVHKQLVTGKNLARKRGFSEQISFVEADYHLLPFRNDSFDIFWSLESIEHARNVDQVLESAVAVLKPGGRIVIAGTFKGRDYLSDKERQELEVGMSTSGVFDFRTAEMVSGTMTQVGFDHVENFNATHLVMRSAHQMALMSRFGLPSAKFAEFIHLTSHMMTTNTQWGTYQEGLFKSGAVSYHVLLGQKPS